MLRQGLYRIPQGRLPISRIQVAARASSGFSSLVFSSRLSTRTPRAFAAGIREAWLFGARLAHFVAKRFGFAENHQILLKNCIFFTELSKFIAYPYKLYIFRDILYYRFKTSKP